jgi:hypothetical protein
VEVSKYVQSLRLAEIGDQVWVLFTLVSEKHGL